MIEKLDMTSWDQAAKLKESARQLGEERRRRVQDAMQKRLEDRGEAQLLESLQNKELGQLKKKLPLFMQREQDFEASQAVAEQERFQATLAFKEQRGRVLRGQLNEHKRIYETAKQERSEQKAQDRHDLQMQHKRVFQAEQYKLQQEYGNRYGEGAEQEQYLFAA